MAAVTVIEQKPLYNILPVGQDIIFVVSNQTAVANETKVKFCAEVHIGTTIPVTSTSNDLKGVFKTTPNNAGVGMFDLRNVIENYVKADNMAFNGSSYKGTTTTDSERHPVHLIDKYSLNKDLVRYMVIQFYVEYLNTATNVVERVTGTTINSDEYSISNGYVKYNNLLDSLSGNFGFDMAEFYPSISVSDRKYLTNAPTTQYANSGDYGTLAFFAPTSSQANGVNRIRIQFYDSTDTIIPATNTDIVKSNGTGAYTTWSALAKKHIVFFGCFPGNLENWSANYATAVAAGLSHYRIFAHNAVPAIGTQSLGTVTIYVNCPDTKNFESIRLCWLNQWGAWDYYTFTKKSTRSISTQGSTYQQLGGTWNESLYRPDSFKGGKKSFRMNATEKILMNTDFVSEDDNVMFEELINSPEVYLLEGYQTDTSISLLNQYVTPVRLTTSSFTRKTVANDRLMQYTFEIEKSKTLRTQSI